METKDRIPVGGVIFADAPVSFNEDRTVTAIRVRNTGDRPVQVGSHFHFFEVNRALEFDRAASYGKRLNIASTTAVRFEPGDEKDVELVPFGGFGAVHGFNDLVDAWIGDAHLRTLNLARADALGFKNVRH